jgi:hypothetical protein
MRRLIGAPGSDRQRYGLLLLAIVLAFSVQGIATPGRWEEVAVTVLLGITLLLALWAADARPWLVRAAAVVVIAVIVTSVEQAAEGTIDGAATRMANALLVALAPPAVVIGVIRNLRRKQSVTVQAVFGVLCVYLLVGMFFAFVYGSIDRLGSAPFFAAGASATVAHCLYYSFTTLTTVGYGDLTASSNLGHTLSVSEALIGQIYLVTVVSLFVGNLSQTRRPRAPESS